MAADFRLCPACGTRNKLKWEFCVKCGESLQDVRAGAQAGGTASPAVDFGAGEWGSTLSTVVALAVAAFVFIRFRPEPARADPSIFANPAHTETLASATPHVSVAETTGREFGEGVRLLTSGDISGSLNLLAKAVADRPSDSGARFAYGQALYQAGRAEEAVFQLREAARLEPRSGRASAEAAKVLLAIGNPADAIPLYEAAVAAEPASPAWLSQLGQLYMDQGNAARAAELFEKAAATSGGNARFLQQLGYAWERAGNSEAAADAYRRALQSDPGSATTRALLAERIVAAGRIEEAIALVREGVGSEARLNRALGSLLERSGRREEAAAAYREYARQNPAAPDAQEMAKRAAALEGTTS